MRAQVTQVIAEKETLSEENSAMDKKIEKSKKKKDKLKDEKKEKKMELKELETEIDSANARTEDVVVEREEAIN